MPALAEYAELNTEHLPEVGSPHWQSLRPRAERYRALVPSMLYAVTTTRPDAAEAVGRCCRCLDNPSEKHLDAADTLLAYLGDTPSVGVVYDNTSSNGLAAIYSSLKEGLYALSDSNHSTGKSVSGFVVMLHGSPIAWGSKLQPVVSLSSTEAEYYAASVCGTVVLAIRNFLKDISLGELHPTPVFVDNSACVNLGKHFSSCRRVKHIDRRVWFLTDYQEQGHIEIRPVTTARNTADFFTKPLSKGVFNFHRSALVR